MSTEPDARKRGTSTSHSRLFLALVDILTGEVEASVKVNTGEVYTFRVKKNIQDD